MHFTWVFVGPTEEWIRDDSLRRARRNALVQPNAHCVGKKPYGELAAYAQCFDVALLPYRKCEPTYSGSSTRFYEHLAAGRPMLATRGFEELLHKQPLLRLFSTAEEGVAIMRSLEVVGFDDGYESLRWQQSKNATWQCRAEYLTSELVHAMS